MKIIPVIFVGIALWYSSDSKKVDFNPSSTLSTIKIEDSTWIGQSFNGFEALNIKTNQIEKLPRSVKEIQFYNFWFSSCGPCLAEMPLFNSLKKKFEEQVEFNAINFESKEEINDFLKETEFQFNQYHLSRTEIHKLKITFGYPTTVMVKDGKIIYWSSGGPSMDSDYLDEKMRALQFDLELKIEDALSLKP